MNKPEYGDLYRFIVSIGILLIASSVAIPWLFLNQPFHSEMSLTEINNLTENAQRLIQIRQNSALWILQNFMWVSIILATLGVLTIIFGIFKWNQKQKLLDRTDELHKEKLEKEVKRMSPEQIALKATQDSIAADWETTDDEYLVDSIRKSDEKIIKYFDVENIVLKKLNQCYNSRNVYTHRIVGDHEIDVIIRTKQSERVLIEIKRLTSYKQSENFYHSIEKQLESTIRSYKELSPSRKLLGLGIVIIDIDDQHIYKNEEFQSQINKNTNTPILVFHKKEFVDMSCSSLKLLIKNALQG